MRNWKGFLCLATLDNRRDVGRRSYSGWFSRSSSSEFTNECRHCHGFPNLMPPPIWPKLPPMIIRPRTIRKRRYFFSFLFFSSAPCISSSIYRIYTLSSLFVSDLVHPSKDLHFQEEREPNIEWWDFRIWCSCSRYPIYGCDSLMLFFCLFGWICH